MKIILTKNRIERIVDITDVEIFTADSHYIIATIGKDEWFVKDKQPGYMASLRSMYANAGGRFVYLDRDKLVRRDQIVGRALGFDGAVAAILAGGQKIKVSRSRRPGFNRLILEMAKKLTPCTDGESAGESKALIGAIKLIESHAVDMGDTYEIRSDIFRQAMSDAGLL